MAKKLDTRMEVRLPSELEQAARAKAKQDGVELSTVVRGLLVLWVRGDVLQTRLDDALRRCPSCGAVVRRRDELAGTCPSCGGMLTTLAAR